METEVDGFAQFAKGRQRALQQTAWLLTGDWALAEDLVQTALIRSWPRWERIRRRGDPERSRPDDRGLNRAGRDCLARRFGWPYPPPRSQHPRA